jgi:glutathione S-transferase
LNEANVHKLKLDYFDFHGGRGEVARLILSIGGIPFEDNRIPVSEWPSVRDNAPLSALPVLHVDGEAITQSNAINRFTGRLAKLYPEDALQALRCDEIMDAVEDVITKVVVTFFIEDEEEKKAAREKLADGAIKTYLVYLQTLLAKNSDNFFVENRLTIADLKVFTWTRSLRAGVLDYIPATIVETVAPKLAEHCDRIAADPGVVAWYDAH